MKRTGCLILVLMAVMSGLALAEEPVYFADANLKAAVEEALGISDPTPTDMLVLTTLWASNKGITDLTGLEYAKNLTRLDLKWNQISNISALSGLTNLTELDLWHNQISDISALSGLKNVTNLYLHHNQISGISALSGLTNLTSLYLSGNQISDISAVAGLANLTDLALGSNQISDISALAGLTNLTFLHLPYNQISDISALSGLTNVMNLSLHDNQISDISALSGMTNLTYLGLYSNQISDISALSGLTNLRGLYLHYNQISDISALSGLTNLHELWLQNNPLNADAYDIYIPHILENNPGIYLRYDPPTEEPLPKEAELAKQVIGAPYLGDGVTWGGKGFNCWACPPKRFVDPDEIKTWGYCYYDGRIDDCNIEKAAGLDCSGLVFWAYNRAYFGNRDLTWEDMKNAPIPFYCDGAGGQWKYASDPIEKEELLPGDLLFLVGHVAMYVGESKVIHAKDLSDGIIEENLETFLSRYQDRFRGFRRVKDADKPDLLFTAKSPVDLIVVDPDGLTIIKELWEAHDMYYREYDVDGDGRPDDVVVIPKRKIGSYLIEVVPQPDAFPTDTYSLEVTFNDKTIVLADNVLISDIPDEPYLIRSTETEIIPIISATIDFDPDTLNLKSKAQRVTVYIELPVGHGYNVSMIDLATLMLNGQVKAEARPMEIGDYDSDSVPDFMVKFDRSSVQEILEVGNEVEMTVTGELTDGTQFEGSNTIRVIDEGKNNESKGMNKKSKGKNKK